MKKILTSFLVSLILVFAPVSSAFAKAPVASPSSSPVAAVDSFDIFWPVVAGKVSGESLYELKLFKETLRETLIFSDYRKADFNITLSVKRAVEAEKLYLKDKKYDQARKTLLKAEEKRQRVYDLIMKASQKGDNVTDLKNTLKSSLEKQTELMKYILTQVPDSEKEPINSDLKSMQELLSKLQ